MENKVEHIERCMDCPFIQKEFVCGLSEDVELDVETVEEFEDISALCPMLDGKVHEKDGKRYKLADWLIKEYRTDIED